MSATSKAALRTSSPSGGNSISRKAVMAACNRPLGILMAAVVSMLWWV
jgi:hypothetical protein